MTLADYIAKVRWLLHDARSVYYTDGDLTKCINDARNRVVSDTGCYRFILPVNLITGQETYSLDDITLFGDPANLTGVQGFAGTILSVMSIFVTWANTRYELRRMSWTELNRFYRLYAVTGNTDVPMAFSVVGRIVYLAPMPNMTYATEWDCPVSPPPLTDQFPGQTDVDTSIYAPYDHSVALYAAHLAKQYDQSFDEADKFFQQYAQTTILNSMAPINRVV